MIVLLSVALAATVYLNGVKVDVLPDATLNNVSVRLDPSGNIWITAPQYLVQEVPAAAAPPNTGPVGTVVEGGAWWLVSQDSGSAGAVVDVFVNGSKVRTVRSGEAQILLDVGPWVHPGANTVRFTRPGGTAPSAGTLSLYVGHGASVAGTVRIERADVRYTLTPSSPATNGVEDFILHIP